MKRILLALSLLAFSPLASSPGTAGGKLYTLEDSARVRSLSVVMHNTSVLTFDEPIGSYAVGDPEIADVLPIRGSEAYLQGKKLGTTNLTVMSSDGVRRAVFDVEVTLNVKGISRAIRQAEPDARVQLTTSNGRIVVSGSVPDAPSAARVIEIVSKFVENPEKDIVNAMNITEAQQVMLEVRFLEVNRNLGKDLGVNWLAQGPHGLGKVGDMPYYRGVETTTKTITDTSSTESKTLGSQLDPMKVIGSSSFATFLGQFALGALNIDVAIQALEAKGVTRRLAEPNLVALSGQEATFLAGGQIPYSTKDSQGNTNTEFQDYGVKLTFTPTVLRDGIINLRLAPEVSQPDATTTGENGQPGLLKRSAQTMVELRDGQTFVIAGLLDGFNERSLDQVPGVGKLPVIGALFRSSGFRKRETELVILVTPRVVRPMVPGTPINTPLDTMRSSSESELFLEGQVERKPDTRKPRTPSGGVVGHILDIGG